MCIYIKLIQAPKSVYLEITGKDIKYHKKGCEGSWHCIIDFVFCFVLGGFLFVRLGFMFLFMLLLFFMFILSCVCVYFYVGRGLLLHQPALICVVPVNLHLDNIELWRIKIIYYISGQILLMGSKTNSMYNKQFFIN